MNTKTTTTDTPLTVDAVDDPAAAVGAAREEVLAQRAVLAEWEARQVAAQLELASLQERAGDEILDNPDAEEEIEATIVRLQSRARSAEKAIAAQRPRVMVAESRYLAAEADALEPAAEAAEQAVAEHDARTAELLAALEAHDGPYISEDQHIQTLEAAGVYLPVGTSWKAPKSRVPRAAATAARRRVTVLRELAAGRDPEPLVREWRAGSDVYPACVQGAGALVPTAQYLRSVARARLVVDEFEEEAARLPEEIGEWERRGRQGDPTFPQAGLDRRHARLDSIGEDIAKARAHLDALTAPAVTANTP